MNTVFKTKYGNKIHFPNSPEHKKCTQCFHNYLHFLDQLSVQFVLFFILVFSSFSAGAQETNEAKRATEKAADEQLQRSLAAAKKWLQHLDQEEFSESWQNGSLTLKLTVPKTHWVHLMESIRQPLGRPLSRKVAAQRKAKDPENLPKGNYMVVLFRSTFPNEKIVNELVTLVLESDGEWRVLTYQYQ